MSIEMPEATILARQMQAELPGKTVTGYELRASESFQRMGFVNKDPADLERLVGQRIESVTSRGNTIRLQLSGHQNLILSPEYGGEVFFWENDRALPGKYHLRLDLDGGAYLTVRLLGMGGIYACCDDGLEQHYMMRRDFYSEIPEPDEERLSAARFAEQLGGLGRQLKSVLVGKDAVVVGLSNAAFQDIIYRAGLHPKRKASDLTLDEQRKLYDAMRFVVAERLRLGGKATFRDLYGTPGGYEPAMGPAMKGAPCAACGTAVVKIAHGGGEVFLCPTCQREPS